MTTRTFPVLLDPRQRRSWDQAGIDYPRRVPWDFVAEHREQCLENHCGQTPERLAERGGLGVAEMLAVVSDRHWCHFIGHNDYDADDRALPELMKQLREWEQEEQHA